MRKNWSQQISSLFVATIVAVMALGAGTPAYALGPNAVRVGIGTTSTLPRNDDGSTGSVAIGFTVNFFGTSYSQLFVNNNGNVTFGSSLATFTPFGLTTNTSIPIIAAFFGDVDTRNLASAEVTYGNATVNGRTAFVVNYDGVGVGYYAAHADKLNNFQLILIDRSDTGAGNFDIEFNYDRIQWETGDASGGSGGLGGQSARVGYSNGSGDAGTFFELAGSGVNGAFLDGNAATGLTSHSLNSTQLGRYIFNVRNGVVAPPDTTNPFCSAPRLVIGPPKQIQVTAQDSGSGLASIQVTSVTNATVDIPAFSVGTTASVVVTATKINQSLSSTLALRITDVAGNVTNCDPVLTSVVREAGSPTVDTYGGLPQAESKILVVNGTPGVQKLEIVVNGQPFQVKRLDDGESIRLDVAAAMRPGSDNTITLRAHGKPGSNVTVMIHD